MSLVATAAALMLPSASNVVRTVVEEKSSVGGGSNPSGGDCRVTDDRTNEDTGGDRTEGKEKLVEVEVEV
ncbi:epithelial membrane protein 1 [Anopheles sinensis]|uniref:Epithelial membrane protein 1 n=1 Tax=Anopheles sinensis TaxID=74873 RepID=A0A084VU11_ANOSI|nr:epithelial membrane protein 1 [Anopheles sinensis]